MLSIFFRNCGADNENGVLVVVVISWITIVTLVVVEVIAMTAGAMAGVDCTITVL